MKASVEITPKMQAEIRRHYLAQGVSETDLAASEDAAIVSSPAVESGAIWKQWRSGNGFRAECPACNRGQVYPDIDNREGARAIRFSHCGRTERLPLLFRLVHLIKLFVDTNAPAPARRAI